MQKIAGVLIPLFSLRDASDFGIGEILHLPAMVDFVLAMDHSAIQLLPLGETSIAEASPYSAMSAFSIDPLFISGAALRGVSGAIRNSRKIAGTARFVPRDRVRSAKSPLLELAWSRFKERGSRRHRDGFEAFQAAHRGWLPDYSLFRALKERFGWRSWEEWPEEIRRRQAEALALARVEMADRIGMYSYFQFLAFHQWLEARVYAEERGVLLGGDLAFSPALDSADVWANQHIFRLDRFVGAPPDAFNAFGQRWGLPMPDWTKMREDDFAWWRMRIR
ncbi:MAG TPA: 4-alpha-glucanotransferase, partial [Candidatus Binataceae bacterium]